MTKVYLAFSSAAIDTLAGHAHEDPVDVLVAYPELDTWEKHRERFNVRSWCLDSGAFSAWNSGTAINLGDYIAACRDVDACEVFGLDVIGDGDATRRNLDTMWQAGVPAIPTFHHGQPFSVLDWCKRHAPGKIALGGVARRGDKARISWLQACMNHVWPFRVHGFGCASWATVEAAPFDTVDASSWVYAPSAMGAWAGYTGRQVALRARNVRDFWIEVVEHRKRADWAAFRWRRELAQIREAACEPS